MREFIAALADPSITFLRYALISGLLASVAFGIVGAYVVARRITYSAGAIAHCILGGIGAALFAQVRLGWAWLDPMIGALIVALFAALAIGLASLYAHEREDTVIGVLWVASMAIGLVFFARTPGYVDPMSYLFGNILLISERDLWLIGVLDALVILLGVVFYNKLVAVCFDEEFARARGIRVQVYYLLLLCLTALTVVLMVRLVGIVLVIALLTLPAAVAGQFSRRMWQMMAVAIVCCALFTVAGLALSYQYDLPSGPSIVLVGAAVYLLALLASSVKGRLLNR